jgi:glucuronokinase
MESMIVRTQAFARAGLIGNPSDGYYGKTISFVIRNCRAEVSLWESPELEILPNQRDHSSFTSRGALMRDVHLHGYYGGIRLLKATVKRFCDYCQEHRIVLDDRNFTLHYGSNIPSRLGLAGSSAIITAGLRALMQFYGVTIPRPDQANLILSVETRELGISAGLQDRVIQVYEGLVYMDFNREHMERHGCGVYEPLDPALLPPLYVAYQTELAEGTEVFHNDVRVRFEHGDTAVVAAMQYWAELAAETRSLLLAGQGRRIGPLLDRNFDKRREIYRISPGNLALVAAARSTGASAKFTGSGGAIVGTYEDEEMFQRLVTTLEPKGVRVFKPILEDKGERSPQIEDRVEL